MPNSPRITRATTPPPHASASPRANARSSAKSSSRRPLAEAEALAAPAIVHLFGLYGRKSAAGERELRNDRGELVRDEAEVDFRTFASRYIVGDPAMVRDALAELEAELTPSEVICRMQLPGIPTDKFEQSLRLFGEEVIARLR